MAPGEDADDADHGRAEDAMNRQGRMQKISGSRILTGTFWACSSARWRRLVRISRPAPAAPGRSGCRRRRPAPSGDEALDLRQWRALAEGAQRRARPSPICISWSTRANSSASGPSVLRATWERAASKPRPASTEMVSRSSASGSALRSACGPVVADLVEVHVRREVAEECRADADREGRAPSPKPSRRQTTRPGRARRRSRRTSARSPGRRSSPAGCRRRRACA